MRRAIVAVVLIAAFGACTDSSGSDAADPCLLQPSEIAAITNATVDAGSPSSRSEIQPAIAFCRYTTSASFGAITLAVQRPGQLLYEEAEAAARANNAIFPPFASISGLGDRAYALGNFVHVLQHDTYLVVQGQDPNAAFAAVGQALARQALLHVS